MDRATPSARIPPKVLFLIATAFGVSSTLQAYWLQRLSAEPMGPPLLWELLLLNLVYWYVPALAANPIMGLAARFPLGRVGWPAQVGVHAAGAIAYSLIHTSAITAARMGIWVAEGRPAMGASWWEAAWRGYFTQLDWLLMTYLFLVGLAHALLYRRESEIRALDAARLETELARAQLQALERQIQPHFLFNTLNTIAGLIRTNVEAADRMIDGLGDLLRMTLHTSGTQEVPLTQEIDVLEKYLDIEQTRFGDRLRIETRVEPGALDALVPNLLLQPLVENAVRHGIAPNARPGRIEVSAAREGRQLVVQVKDSGNGLPPDRLTALNAGVGLGNTRARLGHLYPGAHQCVFSNLPDGFCVTIHLPFHTAALPLAREGVA